MTAAVHGGMNSHTGRWVLTSPVGVIANGSGNDDTGAVPCLHLADSESRSLDSLARRAARSEELTGPEWLGQLALMAHDLPLGLRRALTEFRLTGRPYGGFVISGLPVAESAIGPTPVSYAQTPDTAEARRLDALLLLIGSLLGDPFSFATQQRGRLVLDVFPVPGHEHDQLGSSSTTELEWHNEDAFHPHRADWLMLLCLRNPYAAPTTFGPVHELPLDPDDLAVLFQDRFVIRPDESHTESFNDHTTGFDDTTHNAGAFDQIAKMANDPQRIPILSGAAHAPFIRIDPAYMDHSLDDPAAERALRRIINAIDETIHDVALNPGELLVVDNRRAVHGRRPFQARHDGTDRWLKRINITADLRRSDGFRTAEHGRAIQLGRRQM